MIKAIPATATKLSDLLDTRDTKCQGIYMQAAKANSGDISFGRNGNLIFFIEAGNSATFINSDARNVWVQSSNGTDILSADLIQG